ncbi:peptidyl-prolyl cis-trans isomerase sig-7 [Drosophila hydei]|uniref:Peptidyl-prolyl cis-trans isomerase n=1 Tax=Drosophila hydei TaxID=7224 RepID=A0A6J1MBB4_DROHY|nr:peptidyl-prolyl cis-trans isomerase sig-7 [Drosophila hydei]
MSVVIETTLGDLTVDLFTDERPIACLNFIKLCQLKYYNYNLFHTVQQGFIAQTGDPSGIGNGGSSVWGVVEGIQKRFFEAEYIPKIQHSNAGMLSLVSAGKNLVGSQFFFTLGENLTSLDGNHCVIGEVVEGHELLRKLNDAIVDDNFRPYQDIRITHTVVLEDPFPNPRGFQVPSRSPSPSAERLQNGRIAADEDIDDANGKSMEEMQELLAEREAKARATILEIVGDLPDAEMAPPENVLFVCKLNPVTTDDDLEIIFSRFGIVKGCEVIRDRKTGDSLQYAFVEFEDQKSCEAAYFKMDNVLIDDRRIHVDFSQSVSKVTWRGKGRGVIGDEGPLDFNNLRESNGNKHDNKPRKSGQDSRRTDRNRNDEKKKQITTEERRKAREQRHKEQKDREDRGRRNNLQRSRSRETNFRHNERYERRRSRSNDRNGRRRPTSPYRGSRYSPERRRLENPRDASGDRYHRSTLRTQTSSQNDRRHVERKYNEKASQNVSKDRKRVTVEEDRSSKIKSKRAKSSSSETDDSSDDSDSSSTNSSNESSSDERSKRKKHSKSKQKKSKAKRKHKSKKKHKK